VLLAWYTYRNGQGDKGSLRWDPLPAVLDALEYAFYASFKNVKPTGQRILLALDVSGSMCAPILNTPLSAREAAAAMAMVFARTEQGSRFMAFQDDFVDLDITAGDRLEHVLQATSGLPFGGTDCSLPMLWAIENNAAVDCFIVITDNETYAGAMHPHVALQRYRQLMGIEAKMIVVGMTATEFTIADPEDAGMLDMVGFDASAPEIMRQFLVGDL
jgi:60 kDa SS-A/Ro ribonucleoprotein